MTKSELESRIIKMREDPKSNLRNREYWTKEEEEKITKMFNKGVGVSETAATLNRSEQTVIAKFYDLGLYKTQNRKSSSKVRCLCSKCSFFKDNACSNPSICSKPLEDTNV